MTPTTPTNAAGSPRVVLDAVVGRCDWRAALAGGWLARWRYWRKYGNVTEADCTRCATCGGWIYPGMSICAAPVGAQYEYTHATFDCSPTAGLWSGWWGKGKAVHPWETPNKDSAT